MKPAHASRLFALTAALAATLTMATPARSQPEVPMGAWASGTPTASPKAQSSADAPTGTDAAKAAAEKIVAQELHVVGGKTTVGHSGKTATVLVEMGATERCAVHMRLDKGRLPGEKSSWTATRTVCRKASVVVRM